MRAILCAAIVFSASAARADAGTDSAAVRKANADWVAAWNKHDGKAMAAQFTDDADVINPMLESAHGKADIEKFFTKEQTSFLKASKIDSACKPARMVRPEVAVLDCNFEITNVATPDGKMVALKGNYTSIVTAQAGAWKIAALRAQIPPPAPPSK